MTTRLRPIVLEPTGSNPDPKAKALRGFHVGRYGNQIVFRRREFSRNREVRADWWREVAR